MRFQRRPFLYRAARNKVPTKIVCPILFLKKNNCKKMRSLYFWRFVGGEEAGPAPALSPSPQYMRGCGPSYRLVYTLRGRFFKIADTNKLGKKSKNLKIPGGHSSCVLLSVFFEATVCETRSKTRFDNFGIVCLAWVRGILHLTGENSNDKACTYISLLSARR